MNDQLYVFPPVLLDEERLFIERVKHRVDQDTRANYKNRTRDKLSMRDADRLVRIIARITKTPATIDH